MLDEKNVPPVELDERVARYLVNRRNIRSDQTIKSDEFVPYKHVDLSVNRLRSCADEEIWKFGRQVAEQRGKVLLGRTDLSVEDCHIESLSVIAKPIPKNPNHADIAGYPSIKADQKALALKLAANASKLIPTPDSDNVTGT